MKSKLWKGLTSACSIGLAAVIVSLAVTRGTLEAEAAETLLGIRTLINDVKEQEREYVILEIVPDRSTAGIGTYFSGYEPVLSSWDEENACWKSWQEGLFDCIPASGETPEEARQKYVQELKDKLDVYLADFGSNYPITYSEYLESEGPAEGFTRLEAPATVRNGYFEEASSGGNYALRFMYSSTYDGGFSPTPGVAYYTAKESEIAVTVETDDATGAVKDIQVTRNGTAVADNSPLYSFADGQLVYQCTAGELKEKLLESDLDLTLESTEEESTEEESTEEESTEEQSSEEESTEEETSAEESSGEETSTEESSGESDPQPDSSKEDTTQPDSSEENTPQPGSSEEENGSEAESGKTDSSGVTSETDSQEEPSTADFSASSKRSQSRTTTVTVTLPQLLSSPSAGSVSANDTLDEEKKDGEKEPDDEDGSKDTAKDVPKETDVDGNAGFTSFALTDISADIDRLYVVEFAYVSDMDKVFGQMLYIVDNRELIQEQTEGTYAFVESETGGEYRFGAASIYYQGGFDNQEWFKKYVLNLDEEEYEGFPVRVITMTPEEIEDAGTVPAYDFLYINDGSRESREPENAGSVVGYVENDLKNEIADAIFNDVVVNEKPCVVEGGILFDRQGDVVNIQQGDLRNTNIFRLCAMLVQESPSGYASNFNGLGQDAMIAGILEDQDKNFVTEQTYCVFGKTSIFDGDFYTSTIYQGGAEEIQQGFQDVLNEIEIENLYREADISSQGGTLPTDISRATVIRHIMNYRNRRSGMTKESVRVLEIQPAKTTEAQGLTKEILMEWAPGLQADKITITRMTTAEFIGKVETLNDKYDLIYIGTSKEHMNVVRGTDQGEGSTVFNDHAMDGLIYFHTGDMRYAGMELSGQLDTDYLGGDRNNDVFYYVPVRYGGNDITKEKLDALNSFLNGSYPVIVSDDFFESPATVYQDINYGGYSVNLGVGEYDMNQMEALGIRNDDITSVKVKEGYKVTFYQDIHFAGATLELTEDRSYVGADWNDEVTSMKVELLPDAHPQRTIDEDHIDNCSFMYEFAKGAMDANRSNFYSESDIEDNSRLFQFYLNRPKVNLTGTSANGSLRDGIYYIGNGINGRYTLEYHFTIINEGTASTDTQYQCRFYVDVNADGKFSSLEELGDILITNNGNVVSQNQLYAGREYVMTRNVPDGYKGVLPWKVEVSQVNNPNIYCFMDGYTKLEGLEKETIKILQISRDQVGWPDWWGSWGETQFSLAEQINGKKTIYGDPYDDASGSHREGYSSDTEIMEGYQDSLYHTLIYGGYYGGIYYEGIADDFEIDVDFMTISRFENQYNAGNVNMDDYNMLILGFSDAYGDFTGDENSGPMGAIVAFINSGKSVLFAHDNTSYFNFAKGKRGILNRNDPGNTTLTDQHHNASTLNKYIRDLVGMDRYGITDLNVNILRSGAALTVGSGEWQAMLSLEKDIPYEPKSDKTRTVPLAQGYTYSIINAKDKHPEANVSAQSYDPAETGLSGEWKNEYLNIRYDQVFYHDNYDNPAGVGYADYGEIPLNYNGEVTNLWVTQTNHGQITDYPYKLPETFQVTTTHGQYYQLDFNMDADRDGQSDLVVWYCLGDRTNGSGQHQQTIYSQSPNDASNNYYIYNKGNITYTGMGHAGMDSANAVDEAKLFINTMIAAYSAGLKNPLITVLETGSRNAPSVDVAYRYQDEGNGLVYEQYEGDYEKVYFTVEDVNFVNGSRRLAVKAYFETEDGELVIGDQDGTKRLRDFTANALFYTVEGDQQVNPDNLESGGLYYILVPKSLIRDNEKNDCFQIYLEAQSFITSYGNTKETGKVYAGLEFRKAYLFDIT